MFEMIEEYDVQKEREKAMKKGMKKGMKKRDIEIAIRMLKKGMDIEDIVDITELEREQVEKIKKEVRC